MAAQRIRSQIVSVTVMDREDEGSQVDLWPRRGSDHRSFPSLTIFVIPHVNRLLHLSIGSI